MYNSYKKTCCKYKNTKQSTKFFEKYENIDRSNNIIVKLNIKTRHTIFKNIKRY